MSKLPRGLYESLLTEALHSALSGGRSYAKLRDAEAPDRLALHVASVLERMVKALPENARAERGASIAGELIERMSSEPDSAHLFAQRLMLPPQVLHAVTRSNPGGEQEQIDAPLTPLLDTALLTNAPGEPRVGHEILSEIASADRIDVIMAFVRRSGIAPLREHLRRHVGEGRPLRILTTTYTKSTELEALEWLERIGAEVRVSYDTTATRLHAKAWMFYRESGFSTAYIGSSNLTHSAQVTGLEWNVRVSGARNRAIIEKIETVFESYWQQPDFQPFNAERFTRAIAADTTDRPTITLSPIEVTLWPFQERLLEQIALARSQGRHRNLLVSATGTGKTVMAAVDYARLRSTLDRSRLLFVAHRQEILTQSMATFAHVLRDASFGELWAAGRRPETFEHVFASIQTLNALGLDTLDPTHFDVVIIDEFHHAAAASYTRLLNFVRPTELLGLTATPERGDGLSILGWFDGRIAAELRLWDAISQSRLVPFSYYGIADSLDLRDIPWRRGTGYDVAELSTVITATEVWARAVLKQMIELVGSPHKTRALGFCVSVRHAQYMARVFADAGVSAVAISGESPEADRIGALRDLQAGKINVVFSVDLFNEGIDVPMVDTLLMLRPTDSSLLFLQQLGRGLRSHPGKSQCTVLDFVGQHRKEFRYENRFRALLGGSRAHVYEQIERGFPFLPAGCHMELDRVARERVLENIKSSVPSRWPAKIDELRLLAANDPSISLSAFLQQSGMELEDVYVSNRSWSDLQQAAGLAVRAPGAHEEALRRACGRLLHTDDMERLNSWRAMLSHEAPPDTNAATTRERRLAIMLLSQLVDTLPAKNLTVSEGLALLWEHPQLRYELIELIDVLADRTSHVTSALRALPDVPLRVHARYTRHEILAACGTTKGLSTRVWREGAYHEKELPADLFVFTLDKTDGGFSPSTRYRDYAISRELIHWESQSTTPADSPTGRRYQQHARMGHHVLLFARINKSARAFHFLGPATYVSHVGEMPMAITWRLTYQLPGDLFAQFAAAVA